MADLNKTAGLSHGKVATVMESLGLSVTRGASAQIMQRAAKRLARPYEQIKQHIIHSHRVSADETGWRVGGCKSWLHAFVTPRATCYHIDERRGSDGSKKVLPLDYEGALVRDGWRGYDRYSLAAHQQCLAHLLQRCCRLIQLARARDRPGSAKFAKQLKALLKSALKLRDDQREGKLSEQVYAHQRTELQAELEKLVHHPKRDADNERFARFLYDRSDQVLLFLWDVTLEAANWRAEQAIRPAVVNRKVWGGNRTWLGSQAQMVLSSVLVTLRQQCQDVLGFISSALRGQCTALALA
jgi:transposase